MDTVSIRTEPSFLREPTHQPDVAIDISHTFYSSNITITTNFGKVTVIPFLKSICHSIHQVLGSITFLSMIYLYTESQQITLAVLPKATALISLVSMSYAAQKILRNKGRMQRLYHRLFLGFAIYNMITSISFIVGTLTIPSDVEGVFLNMGSERSCKAQSFFSQLGLGSLMYLSALCICSCFAVRHNFQEVQYRKYEKSSHIACIIVPFVLSILLISSRHYGPDGKLE